MIVAIEAMRRQRFTEQQIARDLAVRATVGICSMSGIEFKTMNKNPPEQNLLELYTKGVVEWNECVKQHDYGFNRDMNGCWIEDANFVAFNIPDIEIKNAKLVNADFSRSFCRAVRFDGSSLKSSNFSDARLGGEWRRQVDPGYFPVFLTDFRNADLAEALFVRADLRYVIFRNAKLRNANFKGSDLRYANFLGADIRGANFDMALLGGAFFDEAAPPSIVAESIKSKPKEDYVEFDEGRVYGDGKQGEKSVQTKRDLSRSWLSEEKMISIIAGSLRDNLAKAIGAAIAAAIIATGVFLGKYFGLF